MNFDDYQFEINKHMRYEGAGGDLLGLINAIMGLGSAYGKISEIAQSWVADWKAGDTSPHDIGPMKNEIAHALAYIVAISTEVGLVVDDVATHSVEMLEK